MWRRQCLLALEASLSYAVGLDLDLVATFETDVAGAIESGQGPVNNVQCIVSRLHGGDLVGKRRKTCELKTYQ
eukprot:10998438-Ditylum_brightwellii.AAC.1